MKTTNLFKAVAFVAMVIVSIMNSEVKAQDRFITNEEVQNDLIVAKKKKPSSSKALSSITCVMNLHTTMKTAYK